MSEDATALRARLEWFLSNIDLQIEDIEFIESDQRLCFFYDAGDVEDSMMGLQAFAALATAEPAEAREHVQRLAQPEGLVRCLLSGGWLGSIEMMPPHQAEFLRGLKVEFGVGLSMNHPEQVVALFFNAMGINKKGGVVDRLETFTSAQLLRTVRERAGRAVEVFKALECVRGTWVTRFAEWRNEGLLTLQPLHLSGLDYNEFVGLDLFHRAKAAFDRERPLRAPANFSDAMAIALLARSVEALRKNGGSGPVPRFFVGNQTWRSVAADATIAESLSYTTRGGRKSSVLRHPDYYFFKSIFQPVQTSGPLQGYRTAFGDLRDLRQQVAEVLEVPFLTSAVVNTVVLGDRTLAVLIDEIRDFSFFENVWLPFSGEDAAKKVLKFLDSAAQELMQERFAIGVGRAIQETKANLDSNLESYRDANKVWQRISAEVVKLRERTREVTVGEAFVFRDLGLLRFGFSDVSGILDTFDALLSSARDKGVGAVMRGMSKTGLKNVDAETSAAVLWVLRLDSDIISMAERSTTYALKLVCAAALFRAKESEYVKRAGSLMEDLLGMYGKTRSNMDKGDLACGLAYLHFRLWKALGGFSSWRDSPRAPVRDGGRALLSAVAFAKEASECLSLKPVKQLYALNQYLYYLVEGAPEDATVEMDKAKDRLLEEKTERDNLWSYRYDDTIARYFHRQASLASTKSEWESYMVDALRYSDIAVNGARGDEEVIVYNTRLREQQRSKREWRKKATTTAPPAQSPQ